MTETVRVDLGDRSYDIIIGEHLLAQAGSHLTTVLRSNRTVVVTDNAVARHHGEAFMAALGRSGIKADLQTVSPGEGSKSLSSLSDLLNRILSRGIDRKTTIIALGGGVVGDLAGFAAAVLLRGVDYIQVPTTLLAQVDSSVGGKTGINADAGKNLIGSFHQPRLVLVDTKVLDTLPDRDMRAGYAEVAKYGAINQPEFFGWLESHVDRVLNRDPEALAHAIAVSCRAKADVVAADERESSQRALLNLGHTFGHALEAEAGYTGHLLHGEAVAIGMVLAFDLSAQLALCSTDDARRVRRHLHAAGLPTRIADRFDPLPPPERLLNHMTHDKKASDGRITLILARGIGQAFSSAEVPAETIHSFLKTAMSDL